MSAQLSLIMHFCVSFCCSVCLVPFSDTSYTCTGSPVAAIVFLGLGLFW